MLRRREDVLELAKIHSHNLSINKQKIEYAFLSNAPYRGRVRSLSPNRLGVVLALTSGVAFAVQPVIGPFALDGGASISGLLGWRYALAAVVLAAIARRSLAAMPRRTAVAAFGLGVVLYAADAAFFYAALKQDLATLRDAAPLRAPRARRRRRGHVLGREQLDTVVQRRSSACSSASSS